MPPREPKHFAYVDAVRGYAFLGVLFCHCAVSCGKFPGSKIAEQGSYGVQLFFLASAITLCFSMATRHEEHLTHVFNFYLRRFFRIAPLFWLSMAFYWMMPTIIPASWLGQFAPQGVHASYFILTSLFLHGWHPYTFNSIVPGGWSIAVEMTFYLIFPLLFYLITSLRKATLFMLFGLLFAKIELHSFEAIKSHVWPTIPDSNITSFFRALWFPSQFPVFLIGIFAYFFLKQPSSQKIYKSLFWSCTLFIFCLMVLLSLLRATGTSGFIPNYLFIVMALAGIVISLAGNKIPGAVNPFICHVGKLSYSCYLTHFAALGIVITFSRNFWNRSLLKEDIGLGILDTGNGLFNLKIFSSVMLTTLVLTLLISTITHHVIENPGIALGKAIILKIRSQRRQRSIGRASLNIP